MIPFAVAAELPVGLAFVAIGIGLTATAGALLARTVRFRWRAVRLDGRVVGTMLPNDAPQTRPDGRIILTSADNNAIAPWLTTVEFDDPAGGCRRVTIQVTPWARARWYAPGDRVPLLCDPADRRPVRVDRFRELWFGPVVLGLLGGGFLVTGATVVGLAGQ